MLVVLGERMHTGGSWQCGSRSHPQTPDQNSPGEPSASAKWRVRLPFARLPLWSFFSCPAKSLSCAADTGRADLDAVRFFEEATMLFSPQVGMRF